MASKKQVIAECGNKESHETAPGGKISDTDRYFSDPKVIEHLKHSIEQAEAGKTHVLNKEEINDFHGLA
ncbi:MAG: type II toxin-antitoxin system Phd/YefM family antitoxin [Chlorobium sp.]